jgi:hypothetical protein
MVVDFFPQVERRHWPFEMFLPSILDARGDKYQQWRPSDSVTRWHRSECRWSPNEGIVESWDLIQKHDVRARS